MNSFQAQFNSLLGIALGAQKLSKKTLGTPSAPTATKPQKESNFMEDKSLEYDPYGFSNKYAISGASMDPEMQKAYEARQRSMQNLINRHEALRAIKQARNIKSVVESKKTNTPLGSIKSHDLGGNV